MNLGSRSEADDATNARVHLMELTMVHPCQETAQILLPVVPTGGTGELIVGVALTADERASRRYRLITNAERLRYLSGNHRRVQKPGWQTEYNPIISNDADTS
jgi:hypothetical protein